MNGVRVGGAPVQQPHRQAEIGFDHEIAVGRGGLRNGPEMDDGLQPAAFQPVRQLRRRHDVGELALGEIAPFAILAEHVAHGDIGAARVIQRGHDIRSDKTGPPGHQQHSVALPLMWHASFAPLLPGRQLGQPAW